MFRKVRITLLAVLTAFAAFALPGAAHAEASPVTTAPVVQCSTYTADGIAPYSPATGRTQGLLELRYNSCNRTVWARVSTGLTGGCLPAQTDCGYATIHRNSDGAERSCATVRGAKSCYTAALNDANVTSYAHGSVDAGAYSYMARTINF